MSFTSTFLGLSLMSLPLLTFAHTPIENYHSLLEALSKGHEVRAIISLGECHTEGESAAKSSNHIGGMNFTQFNKYQISINNKPTNMIATSINMLVESAQHGPVYNYVRLRVFENNQVEMASMFLHPQDYSVISKTTFQCAISNDNEHHGIRLYDIS